jgi:hypothetical protein
MGVFARMMVRTDLPPIRRNAPDAADIFLFACCGLARVSILRLQIVDNLPEYLCIYATSGRNRDDAGR